MVIAIFLIFTSWRDDFGHSLTFDPLWFGLCGMAQCLKKSHLYTYAIGEGLELNVLL